MPRDRLAAFISWVYLVSIAVSIFSGFGNMPLYGRYYVTDIPGFGWSSNFYINLYIHYLSGAAILMVSTYVVCIYLQRRGQDVRMTTSGILRSLVLGFLLLTGVLAAVKNLPFINLSHGGLMLLAFAHLGGAMTFIFLSLACKIMKKPWVVQNSVV